MTMKIGAQFYTIRDFCQTIEDFDEACRKVREIGYRYIQLSGTGDFLPEDLKPILEKYDLAVVCTHRNPQRLLENIEKEIAFHKVIGCCMCGLGSMPGFEARPETIDRFIRNFKPVAKRLKEENLLFTYHNHAFEFEKINGKYAFEYICEGMDSDNFKCVLDVYWLAYAGINPAKFIREHKEQIACLHFKDMKVVNNTPTYAEVGCGNLDWEDIIAASQEAGIEFALVEQDECDKNPFDCLKTSYQFLKERGLE